MGKIMLIDLFLWLWFIHSFYQSTTLLILTVNLRRKVFDARDFAYHGMSVVDNLYLQRSLVASLPYGSHLCCGKGAWCSKLPWLRSMEIAHMEGGVRNMQFRLCVSLCMLTRLRWIIIVSYCFVRTECRNATRNLVSLFHCRAYHIIFNRGRQLNEVDSHTLVVALRRLWREFQSIRPEVSSYDVIRLETLVNAIAEDFLWGSDISGPTKSNRLRRSDADRWRPIVPLWSACHWVTEVLLLLRKSWTRMYPARIICKCHRVPPGGI